MSVPRVTRIILHVNFFAMWNFSGHKCPSFPDPQPASLGPCYVPLGLKDSHLCALTSHREASKLPPPAFFFFLFPPYLFLTPKPKSCESAGVDVARKLLRWALSHLVVVRDKGGGGGRAFITGTGVGEGARRCV